MGLRSYKSLAGLALALVTGFARADSVTFDDLPRHHSATDLGSVIEDGNFTFLSQQELFAPSRRDDADPHGQTLASMLADQALVVYRSDHSSFNLVSLELGSVPASGEGDQGDDRHRRHHGSGGSGFEGSSGDVELLYYQGSDPQFLTMILHLDATPGLQFFDLNLENVSAFGLYGVPFQLDNVITTADGDAAPVPEPGALSAMLAGLAFLVTLARRRKA